MQLQALFLQLQTLFKNLSPAKRFTLLLLVVATATGFIFLMTWTAKPNYQLLYSNLAAEDAGEIISNLRDKKIPYQIAASGSSILVPREQIYEIRMELAAQGLPQGSGVGFEIFDNTKLGMTEFVQNVNYQRALQGELARTINRFSEVENARVHIVMASKSLFAEREKPATASVVLKLRAGRWLDDTQIQGIIHLLSSSVAGLQPPNVTIVDNSGKMLAGFKDKSALGKISSDQLEYQEKIERGLENRIKTMLESAFGPSRAIVRIACLLDFKRLEKTEERFDPENRVVRSEQLSNENGNGIDTMPIGVPGPVASMNIKEPSARINPANPAFQRQDRTVNYEIGKVTSHVIEPVGTIQRISVAVLIDGVYQRTKDENGEEQVRYVPRSSEEMAKIETIVKSAVNFDPERGDKVEVANLAFETPRLSDAGEETQPEGWFARLSRFAPPLKYGFAALFVLLTFFFVVRPIVRWLTLSAPGGVEILNQLPRTVGEIEREYDDGVKSLPFREMASQMIAKDNKASVELMRSWLKENS